ncbi:MAG: thioesterase family protein [Myxococcota bacterium]
MSEPEPRWPVRIEIPVAWGDMDSLGHVNNTVYLRWFESVRIRYFEGLGLMDRFQDEKIGPILAHQRIDYRRPLRYPDTVEARIRVAKLGNTSLTMAFELWSISERALAASGEGVVVLIDYKTSQKLPLPDDLRAAIANIEAA